MHFEQELGLLRLPVFDVHEDGEGPIEAAPVHMDAGHAVDDHGEQGDIDDLARLSDDCIGGLIIILR